LNALWQQGKSVKEAKTGLVYERSNFPSNEVLESKIIPDLHEGAFTIEFIVDFNNLVPGQVILDNRDDEENGLVIKVTLERTIELILSDDELLSSLATEPGMLEKGQNHVVFVVDGRAKLITSIV